MHNSGCCPPADFRNCFEATGREGEVGAFELRGGHVVWNRRPRHRTQDNLDPVTENPSVKDEYDFRSDSTMG